MLLLLLNAIIIAACTAFQFEPVQVTPISKIIQQTTQYTIFMNRRFLNAIETNWSSSPVPGNSAIIVKFPNDYTLTGTETCDSLQINSNTPINNCTITISISNKTITISNAIPSIIAISSVTVVLNNVMNPYPAVTTSPFVCTIGVDTSLNDLSASLTIIPASFTTCAITFANQTVNTTSNMIVNLTTKNQITSNGEIRIKFPSTLRWTREASLTNLLPLNSISCNSLSSTVNTGVICSGNSSAQTITLSNLTNTTIAKNTFISISVGGLFSPPTTESVDILTLSSMFPNGSLIDNSDCYITNLKPKSLTQFSIGVVGTKKTINTYVTLSFTLINVDTITNEDYFQFHFPIATVLNASSVGTSQPFRVVTPPIFYSSTAILNVTQQSSSQTRPINSSILIIFSLYQTPASLKPTEDIVLRVMKAGYSKMEGKVNFVADPNTYDFNVNLNTTATGVPVECKLNFTMLDSITSTGYIILNIPSQFTIGSLSVQIQSNSSQTSTTPTLTKLSQTSYNISSLSSSSVPPQTLTIIIRHLSTPAYAQNISNFSMSIYYSSQNYLTANGNQLDKLEIPAGVITNVIASVSPNTTYTSGEISLSFSLQNGIDVSGTIVITIPKQIQTTSPSCILSNTISNSTIPQACLYNSVTNQITLTLSAQITTAQNLLLKISSIITPNSTAPTQTFKIATYDSGQHKIDILNNMVTLSVQQPNNLTAVTNRQTVTNSGEGWWQIKVDLVQDLDVSQSNKIWVSFAQQILLESNLTAMINSIPTLITIQNSTPLSLVINIPSTANKSFNLNLSDLINSASLQALSNPYTIFVGYQVANVKYYYSKGVGGSIENSLASQFSGVGYTFSNAILFDTTTLELDINLTSYQNVFSITLQLTPTLTFPSIVNCSPTLFTCTANSSILTITSSQPLSQTIHILISTISTPTTFLAIYPSSILTSYNINGYAISNNSDIRFISKCIENCWKCQSNGFSCLECYKQEHQVNDQKYLQGTTCVQNCFNGWFADGFQCLQCGGNCLECENTSTSCTACPNSTYLHEQDCIQTCPNTTYPSPPSNQTLTCVPCPSPCLTCSFTPLIIVCTSCNIPLYLHNGNCMNSCPVSTTIPNPTNQSCDFCSQQCLTCQNTTDTCTSCNSSYVLINSSCMNQCGDAKIVVNGSCVECLPQCSKCKIQIDNCLQCKPGYFLFNNTCNNSCPPHYYQDNNLRVCGYCGNLSLNCIDCDSTGQKCLSCQAPFIFFNEQCVLNLPDGYYNDSGQGKKCQNQCKTCNITSDHCLTCIDGLFLQGTDCVANCSNGSTPIGNICLSCNPPCTECLNSTTTCTACSPPNYLYAPNSTCIPACPNTTFPSNTTQKCELCPSPCKTCLFNQSCTSCENNFYLNNNGQCVSICSDGWVGVNGTCLQCQTPCQKCIADVTNCTTCLGQFYAYEGQCIVQCPLEVTIPDDNNMTCINCASPCKTCINLTTTCTSCITGTNLYNSQCLQTCPNTTYPSAQVCLPCQAPCLSCSSSTICTSCLAPLLLYQTSCVDTCPSTHAIIRESKCTPCSPTITNCITCTSSLECLTCENQFILFEGACYIDCPTGYVYNSEKDTCISVEENTDEDLDNVLATSSIFPMPFTIIWISIFVAMIMSKLQNKNTYLIGAAYCTSGVLQTGALIFLTIKFYLFSHSLSLVSATESTTGSISGIKQIPLLAIGLIIIYAINVIGLAVQTPLLYWDKQFQVWLKNSCFHKFFFAIISILSVLISYKLKLIIFCKLFSFSCTRGQLQSVQKFRIFNFLSFLGVGHEVFVIYVSILLILRFQNQIMNHQMFLIFIDTIAVTFLGIIFSIIVSKKDDEFFVEQAENGYKLNKKVIAEGDDYCKQGLDPKFLKGQQNKIQQMDSFQKMFLDEQDEDDEYQDEEISLSISENRSQMDRKERMKRNYDKNAGNIERNKSQFYTSKTVKKLSQDREETSNAINRDLFKGDSNMNHNILAGKESERQYKEDEVKDKSQTQKQVNANEISKSMIQQTDRSESKGTYADKMQVIFDENEESEKEQNKQNDGQIENKIAQKMKELQELRLETNQQNEQPNQNTVVLKDNTQDKTFQIQHRNQMLFEEEDVIEDEFIKQNSTLIQLQKQQRQQRRLFEEKQHDKIDEELELMGDLAESKDKTELKENNFVGQSIEEYSNQEIANPDEEKDKSKTLDQQNNQEHNELHDYQNNLETQNEEIISNQNINLDDESDHRQNNDDYFDDFLQEKQILQQNNNTPRQFSLKEGQKQNLEKLEAITSTDQNQAKQANDVKQQYQQKIQQNANEQNVNTEQALEEKVNEEKTNKKKDKYKGLLDFEDQEVQGSGLDDSSPEFEQQINNNPLRSSFASQNRSIELPRRQQTSGHPLVNLLQVSSSKNQTQTETRRDDNARTTLTQYFGHSETKTTRFNNEKPPLQRPSSQQRGRLYAAGVRQMEANKRNSRQKSRKKSQQSEQPQPMISLDHKKKNKSLYSVPMNKMSRKDSRQVSDLTDQFIQPQGYFAPSSEEIHMSNLNYSSTMNIETTNEPDKPRLIGLTSRPNYKGVSTSQQRNRKKRENPNSGGSQMFRKKSIANSRQQDDEDEDELNEFYNRKLSKSRSKQKNMSRESLERMKQLQKVYLQRLDGGKKH